MSAQTTSPALPTTGLWVIDPIHSTVQFTVRHHSISSYRATFEDLQGWFDGSTGLLSGEVEVANLQVGMPILYKHLMHPDFFGADDYPTIAFRSTSIRPTSALAVEVDGELTMKGVTKHVTTQGKFTDSVLVKHPDKSEGLHFALDLATTIDRRDFGVSFNNELPGGIRNLGWNVRIDVTMELCEGYDPTGRGRETLR